MSEFTILAQSGLTQVSYDRYLSALAEIEIVNAQLEAAHSALRFCVLSSSDPARETAGQGGDGT